MLPYGASWKNGYGRDEQTYLRSCHVTSRVAASFVSREPSVRVVRETVLMYYGMSGPTLSHHKTCDSEDESD